MRSELWRIWLSAVLALMAAPHSALAGIANCDLITAPLLSFEASQPSAVDALLQLGRQQHLPVAIEYVDTDLLRRPVILSLRRTTIGGAMRAILGPEKGYRLRCREGVVVITRADTPSIAESTLAHTLATFSVPRCTIQAASNALRMALELETHPSTRGFVGDYSPGNTEDMVGPLSMRNVTVRQVLDRLIASRKDAAWVIQVAPHRAQRAPSRPWRIFDYNDPATTGHVGDILSHTAFGTDERAPAR
jgi:hypothetical protein